MILSILMHLQSSNQQSSSASSLTGNVPDRDVMLELQMLREQVSRSINQPTCPQYTPACMCVHHYTVQYSRLFAKSFSMESVSSADKMLPVICLFKKFSFKFPFETAVSVIQCNLALSEAVSDIVNAVLLVSLAFLLVKDIVL